MDQDQKYVILKKEDWDYILGEGKSLSGWSPHTENYDFSRWTSRLIPDGTVIRRQDLFAGPALSMYAQSMGVALQLMPPDAPERTGLEKAADYFHEMAELASQTHQKVPD